MEILSLRESAIFKPLNYEHAEFLYLKWQKLTEQMIPEGFVACRKEWLQAAVLGCGGLQLGGNRGLWVNWVLG